MTGFGRISGALRGLLEESDIIARCELILRTYDAVLRAELSEKEMEELRGVVGERIAPGIFASIMSGEPIFYDLPRLDSYTVLEGHIFHFLHTKGHDRQDFEAALERFHRVLPDLKEIMRQSLSGMCRDFMARAGYGLLEEEPQALVFSSGERRLKVFIFTSVRSVDIDLCMPTAGLDCVILIPSGESLTPFMEFYREWGDRAEEAGIQAWVANMEQGTIDPFIGYTADMDIYQQFENPRLAEVVRSNWRPGGSVHR